MKIRKSDICVTYCDTTGEVIAVSIFKGGAYKLFKYDKTSDDYTQIASSNNPMTFDDILYGKSVSSRKNKKLI